MTESSQNCET